jgi:hypothetical protein
LNGRRNAVAAPWSAPQADNYSISTFDFRISNSVYERIVPVLGSRRWPLVLALAAILVSLPAVTVAPLNDDLIHRATLVGRSASTQRLSQVGLMPPGSGRLRSVLSDLFIAVAPEANLERLRAYGALPWWTCDEYRVAFWRPVASFTHWLDYRLFPGSFAAMHVHSILWFAAAVCAVTLLYRRLIDAGWVAGLAGLLFVLDSSSYFPTMWVANRNLLLSLFFGVLAILAHDRWRKQAPPDSKFEIRNLRFASVVAPLCLLASVLSAEAGVAAFAYLFAYEVALERGPRLRRVLALVPSLAVIVLWRLFYNLQGYGAYGGEFYFDPGRDPAGYAVAVLRRAPFLLGGQWTTTPADLYGFLPPESKRLMWLILAALTVLIPIILLPILRTSRRARFWLVGMYVAVLPFCATIPMGRSLLFVAIGGFGLVAEVLADWVRRADWVQGLGRSRRLVQALVIVLAVAHLPWAAATRASAAAVTAGMGKRLATTAILGDAGCLADQDLVIVNAPNPVSFLYDPYRIAWGGEPLPRGIRMLAPGYGAVRVTRTGPRRLVVKAVSNSLLDCQHGKRMDFVFFYRYLSDVRGDGHSLHAGQRITVPRMSVEVLAVDKRGFPVETAFEFDVPLEDASLKWLYWDWEAEATGPFKPFAVPPVGATVELVGPF